MTVCELTDLLEQVDSSYIEEAAAPLKRNKKSFRTWLIAAAVAASLTVTAAAVSHYMDLSAYLKTHGLKDTTGVEQLSETLTGQGSFSNELAEYRIMDASCDSSLIYLTVEIQAKAQDQMAIPQYVTPEDSVQVLNIDGVTEGTVLDFVRSKGKTPVYASFSILSNEIGTATEDVKFTPEGVMYVYMSAPNTTGKKNITLHCTGTARPAEDSRVEAVIRSEYELIIHDRSSTKTVEFKTFDKDMGEDIHITPICLTFEETEMGTLVTFTYRGDPNRANNTHFCTIVDAEGQELPWMPVSNGECRELPGGRYAVTQILQKIPSFEGLQLRFPNHDPYGFSK